MVFLIAIGMLCESLVYAPRFVTHARYFETRSSRGPHKVAGHIQVIVRFKRILVVAPAEYRELYLRIGQLSQCSYIFVSKGILQIVNGAPQVRIVLPSGVFGSPAQIVI